ncbi:hypothetical protein [Spirosoma aerolatum]|uniref:hypothetical protein n=1 Tax=Spirosoma aerolatum TaxID=1211326 RepID=UPI0012D2FEAA|nr:hypothetical protein [Spirosoma aerolatum]
MVAATTINPEGELYPFMLLNYDVEVALDLLTRMLKNDIQLLTVALIDSLGNYTYLPVQAIDGTPLSDPIKKLQHEWEEILYCH